MGVTSSTLKSWRERPPSSYSLKIQNFSKFEKSTLSSEGKYESSFFSSGGYNWRLIIYPNGNSKDQGSGFISMYVEKIDTTSLMSTPQTEVFADLRFFVFNKTKNAYFAIQYIEPKPFNTLRTVWGMPQMLTLDTFNDPKEGYIFDGDECEFGVDVIVSPPHTNWEILSFDQEVYSPKISWSLKNFSELEEEYYKSTTFSMGERNWYLRLYPKGDARADGKWLSIFLCVAETEIIKEDEKIFAQANMRIVDPYGSNHVTLQSKHWYNNSCLGWGHSDFVPLPELLESYLDKEGTLTIEMEFDLVSETKYSLPKI